MLKKAVLTLTVVMAATSGTANAGFFESIGAMTSSFMPSVAIKKVADNPANESSVLKLQGIVTHSPQSAHRAFQAWEGERNQQAYSHWPEVGLNMLRWLEPGHTYDWKNGMSLPDGRVAYQQDSLVDLERTQAIHQSFEVVTEQGRGYGVRDGARPHKATPFTSERLLSLGQPPIGPDNRPVLICKLGQGSQAPFIEMTEGQRQRFELHSGLSLQGCLNGSQATAYWRNRYGDFVDGYYDRTSRHLPGESR